MKNTTAAQETLTAFRTYLLGEEKSTATAEKYLRVACVFLDFVKNDGITRETAIAFKTMLTARYAPHTVNAMLAALNCLLQFLHCSDCKVKNLRTQRQTYRPEEKEVTNAEYHRLVKAAGKDSKLALLLQTFSTTGIRVSELQYFSVERVRTGKIVIRCKGKIREILLTPRLQKELLRYAGKQRITSGSIFLGANGRPMHRGSIWAQFKKLCREANVEASKVFPHNLRKLFARNFYAIEKDISALADILGHSNIETTRIYIMTTIREHQEKLKIVERKILQMKNP